MSTVFVFSFLSWLRLANVGKTKRNLMCARLFCNDSVNYDDIFHMYILCALIFYCSPSLVTANAKATYWQRHRYNSIPRAGGATIHT